MFIAVCKVCGFEAVSDTEAPKSCPMCSSTEVEETVVCAGMVPKASGPENETEDSDESDALEENLGLPSAD